MDMTGEFRLAAAPATVWAALNDADILRRAVPGCEEMVRASPTEFRARVTARIGPVKASFAGAVTLSDLDPPRGYRITGEGTGGAAGFARGGATVRLEPDGAGTILRYQAEASVGGKLAQIGSRLIDAAAQKMANEFFERFAAIVGPVPTAAAPAPAAPPEAAPARLPPALWIPALILLVLLGLLYFAAR